MKATPPKAPQSASSTKTAAKTGAASSTAVAKAAAKPAASTPPKADAKAPAASKTAVATPKAPAKAPLKPAAKVGASTKTTAAPAATMPPSAGQPLAAKPAADSARSKAKPSAAAAKNSPVAAAPQPVQSAQAASGAKASFTPIKVAPVIAPVSSASVKKDPKLANNWKTKPPEQLSDAELLAMPDVEYMNDAQMAAFRHRLVELKQAILNNAGETTEHLREDTSIVPDPADRATIEEEHALELRTRDRERKLLKKIEMSIARIDAGDYGYCDETGEPIGVGRLLARPTATLSLEAQQRRELKQKMYGD
ncbi:MAG: RNA polymerase-binding protein DksA [Rhodoferax sp.]